MAAFSQRFSQLGTKFQPCVNKFSHLETRFGTYTFCAVFNPISQRELSNFIVEMVGHKNFDHMICIVWD